MYISSNYRATLMCIIMRLQTKDIVSNNNLLHITDLFIQYRCVCVALRGLFIVFLM